MSWTRSARSFLEKSCQQIGRAVKGFSTAVQQMFHQYSWPGNVRELANVVESAVLLGSNSEIVLSDLPEVFSLSARTADPRHRQTLTHCRRETIQTAIESSRGNLTLAAKLPGVHRNYLYRLMKSLDIRQSETGRRLKSA